jgi:hypothetical protein
MHHLLMIARVILAANIGAASPGVNVLPLAIYMK